MKKILKPSLPAPGGTPAPTVARLVLKVPDFAERWGVKKSTAWNWLARGCPHLKISYKNTKVPIAEADAWVKQNFLRQRGN
jgi:hypothetical protein